MSYIPWIPPILFFVWFIGMMIYSRIDDSKKIKERENKKNQENLCYADIFLIRIALQMCIDDII